MVSRSRMKSGIDDNPKPPEMIKSVDANNSLTNFERQQSEKIMGKSKKRKRKTTKPPAPKKRIRCDWKTCLVYVPLTLLAFGMILGATLLHVLQHPDLYHVTVFSGFVLGMIYLSYTAWKTQ